MPNEMPNQTRVGGLTVDDYNPDGSPKTVDDDVASVVQFLKDADADMNANIWKSGIKESDLLYQSPQPFTTFNNAYILEPNVRRFTIAQAVNSIVPQFYKGLFYEDPCFQLRPGSGGTQEVASLKRDVNSSFLRKMHFAREVKIGLEQFALLGTGVWHWGIRYEREIREKRISRTIPVAGSNVPIYSNNPPRIEREEVICVYPFFENVDVGKLYVDPKLSVPDIREANEVASAKYITYDELLDLRDDPTYDGLQDKSNEELKEWFRRDAGNVTMSAVAQQTQNTGVVQHAQNPSQKASNPLMSQLEMISYWCRGYTITVLNRQYKIRKMDNPWGIVPYLSANYWNIRENFRGIGIGMIAGGDQRVQAGTVGAALKLLTFRVNAPYLRNADANMPSQTVQTGLGRILSVADITKAYSLLETPEVPESLWATLAESVKSTETTTGADQMLVGGSSAGPRSSMGRTAGGASILAGASATRLDGPLDNFIDQVFVPFMYVLDNLIKNYVSDRQIMDILGKKRGPNYTFDLQQYHDFEAEYDVLAGAKLAARAAMAQSLILIFQLLNNPEIQQNLMELNGEYIDFKPLLRILFEVSQWGSGIENDIFKPATAEMKAAHAAKTSAAVKLQQQMAVNNQKFVQRQQLNDQDTDNRIKQTIVRDAFKSAGLGQILSGNTDESGFGGSGEEIQ